MDTQEAALRAGGRPGDPGWGSEPPDRHGALTTEVAGLELHAQVTGVPGDYGAFYAAMAAAVAGEGPVPVAPEEARATVLVIERALQSSREGRVVEVAPATPAS
jgi:scyllo-inositol 2-dehydrogenase (NADP+)